MGEELQQGEGCSPPEFGWSNDSYEQEQCIWLCFYKQALKQPTPSAEFD
jgi:hypothetical protein